MSIRLVTATLATALLAGAAYAAPATERDRHESGAASDLLAAADAAKEGNCERTITLAVKVIEDKEAALLPEDARAAALMLAAGCEATLGRSADAYRHIMAATMFPASDDAAWELRLALELQDQRNDAAISTIEAMTQGRGAALNAIPIKLFGELHTRLKSADASALRRRLLAVLTSSGYTPDEPGATVDGFRQRYAEMLHDAGDQGAAAGLIRRIEHPSTLLEISLDPRFRSLLPADFDLRRSVEQALERARRLAALHPDRIAPVNEVALYLRVLGKPKESLDVLEPLRPRIAEAAMFVDRDEHLVWWWDSLSRGHEMLGDYARTVDALRRGGELEESGGLNVSQIINLSQVQLEFGLPADALATLRVFDESKRAVSPYGTMQIVGTRGCAKARLGKPGDASTEVAFVQAHREDAPKALTSLLLCVGDLAGAGAALVERLDDPDQRAVALRELSDYDDPPVALPPDPRRSNLETVKARPEVRAAIRRAGGTRRFHVQDINF